VFRLKIKTGGDDSYRGKSLFASEGGCWCFQQVATKLRAKIRTAQIEDSIHYLLSFLSQLGPNFFLHYNQLPKIASVETSHGTSISKRLFFQTENTWAPRYSTDAQRNAQRLVVHYSCSL
jgi:hypothetical protein